MIQVPLMSNVAMNINIRVKIWCRFRGEWVWLKNLARGKWYRFYITDPPFKTRLISGFTEVETEQFLQRYLLLIHYGV